MDVKNLLAAREKTHGNFDSNARISQNLKTLFRSEPGWNNLNSREQETLDNIALKVSRILSGGSLLQHWEDIIGYVTLVTLAIGKEDQT